MVPRKPRPRSRHGGGEGWNWAFPGGAGGSRRGRKAASGKGFSLFGAITRVVNWFTVDGKRYRTTQRKRGRRHMARVHPHRYRRREYER